MFVMDVGRCHHRAVGQCALAVHTDVEFHSKVPLLALAGLVGSKIYAYNKLRGE
jgi:hypothetical protein